MNMTQDTETGLYLPRALVEGTEVELSDITLRDGIQSWETIISTKDKLNFLEGLILSGFKRVEASNYGHPVYVPFFGDIDDIFKGLLNSEKVGHMLKQNGGDVELTAVSISKRGAERAFKAYQDGYGPDRILQMVSTCPDHQKANSNMTHDQYWAMTEEVIKEAHNLGILVNGTVSTIWGSPFKHFESSLEKAVEFVKHYLSIGADDIEHADHDGSVTNYKEAERYFKMIMNPAIMGIGEDGRDYTDPSLHIAHFHTKSMASGLRNVLGALRAGIIRYESCMGGIGGQPAAFVDGELIHGRGGKDGNGDYYSDHFNHGLVSTEDVVVMMHQLGIVTEINEKFFLNTVASAFKERQEQYNEHQNMIGRSGSQMKCRSYMMTDGQLPQSVTALYTPPADQQKE